MGKSEFQQVENGSLSVSVLSVEHSRNVWCLDENTTKCFSCLPLSCALCVVGPARTRMKSERKCSKGDAIYNRGKG